MAYLNQPTEKANEDLALAYFRKVFGETFTRQQDAKRSDGYVPGYFVLELKGKANDWLSGLFQALAYRNHGLQYAQIVVAAKTFLAIWRVEDIPQKLLDEVAAEQSAPNTIGRIYAKKYSFKKKELLKLAVWKDQDLFAPLFASHPDVVLGKFALFEKTLKQGRKVRQNITPKNLAATLKELKSYFSPEQPIKAVRAFYSMLYAWSEFSAVSISRKSQTQATLDGELVTDLIPSKRQQFKNFVESRCVAVDEKQNYDDFFAKYDEALDAADPDFRIKHGIFFTDLDLSRFVMWMVKQHVPDLGKNYLVIDPACGSGNLVTNWRSPLELRHKVVSEIEPELLFAVEQRMKGDAWHDGRFTVVPKVSENRGLNFLDCSADEYLDQVREALQEKGQSADKPFAFLCNPPYRSDDDQAASSIGYKIHPSILALTGADGANERYCCFLAQMKMICESAVESGLPGESLLLVFTKSAWLTKRPIFQNIRTQVLGAFEPVAGFLMPAREFFDIKGSWPVAFSIWRYKGKDASLDANRSVPLIDLTWVTKKQLSQVVWNDPIGMDACCREIVDGEKSRVVELGLDRVSIRTWAGGSMLDFKRDRRKAERSAKVVGGLPLNDSRQANKKAYGEIDGGYIGFMDDLTPCRVKNSTPNRPWLNLDNRFMAVKKSRCFSGPPTHLGYCASDLETGKRLFFWYALGRTFVQCPYPMWIDADGMWAPSIPSSLERQVFQTALAIAFAENECVETTFPANNPVAGVPELAISNPMTPNNPQSFWSGVLRPFVCAGASEGIASLVDAVDAVYLLWNSKFSHQSEIIAPGQPPYFIGDGVLKRTAGLVQIKDYAVNTDDKSLLQAFAKMQARLKATKQEFHGTVSESLAYFGERLSKEATLEIPEKTRFERTLCKRMALAGLLVEQLHNDPHFGRTKLAKLFYLAETHEGLSLDTEYVREAAGPLDQRAFYNEMVGIEALARKYKLFEPEQTGRMVRYTPASGLAQIHQFARQHLEAKVERIDALAKIFKNLTTDQSEIIATLYACWNDFLLRDHKPTDEEVITEFLLHWHPKKARFPRSRLTRALSWMRTHGVVPSGTGRLTNSKAPA